jgi:hypothetical protein
MVVGFPKDTEVTYSWADYDVQLCEQPGLGMQSVLADYLYDVCMKCTLDNEFCYVLEA